MALTQITIKRKRRWQPPQVWRYWNVDLRWCRRYDMRKAKEKKVIKNKLPANYWQLRGEEMRRKGIPSLGTGWTRRYR